MTRFALFDTALGTAALAWRDDVVVGVQLPEPAPTRTEARLLRYFPEATSGDPSPVIRSVITRIVALLDGGTDDLRDVAVELSDLGTFQRRVYDYIRGIEPGHWMTYGQVAEAVGEPGGAQAVGQAMGSNPVPIIVPCHRVVAAGGKLGGFSASGGAETKRRMLVIEGAGLPVAQPALFD